MIVRVRFAETDAMRVAHHAAYVVWLEAARVEWMRSIGASYRDLDEGGVSIAVTGLQVHYRRPVRFDDEVEIACRLTRLRSRSLTFAYTLACTAVGPVAEATTDHVPVDRNGRSVRLPRSWLDVVTPFVVGPQSTA